MNGLILNSIKQISITAHVNDLHTCMLHHCYYPGHMIPTLGTVTNTRCQRKEGADWEMERSNQSMGQQGRHT